MAPARYDGAFDTLRGVISLCELIVWLDVGFTVLYVLVVLALRAHFAGNILTGRIEHRFVDRARTDHEARPVPVLHKALHLSHVSSMFILGFAGLYIRFPFFDGGRATMGHIHYFFMVIVPVGLVWRLGAPTSRSGVTTRSSRSRGRTSAPSRAAPGTTPWSRVPSRTSAGTT